MKKKWLYGIIAVLSALVIFGGTAGIKNAITGDKTEDTPTTETVSVVDLEV